MKRIIIISTYLVLLVVSTAVSLAPQDHFEVTTGHKIDFKNAHVKGVFKSMNGSMDFNQSDMSKCKFSLKIPVTTISTGNAIMDKKAQTAEWFDSKKHPNISFVSSSVAKSGAKYNITGTLNMKGVAKTITIPVSMSLAGTKITFTGSFTVNRITYGVGKKSENVPDNLSITVTVPGIKK